VGKNDTISNDEPDLNVMENTPELSRQHSKSDGYAPVKLTVETVDASSPVRRAPLNVGSGCSSDKLASEPVDFL